MISIDLTGKTAFVSGSSQGIGYAIASRLAQAGARVALNGRSGVRVVAAAGAMETTIAASSRPRLRWRSPMSSGNGPGTST